MRIRAAVLCVLLGIPACGGAPATPDAAVDVPATPDVAFDVSVADADDAPATPDVPADVSCGVAPCDASLSWTAAAPFTPPRDHQVTFILEPASGARLYVAGGNVSNMGRGFTGSLDVVSAPLGADGSLGAFVPNTPLPERMAGPGVAVIGDVVVVAGGIDDVTASRHAYSSRVNPDGTLGAWARGPDLPAPRFHNSASAFERWVYVVGGFNGATTLASVARAELAPDGTLGPWVAQRPLPATRSHHAAVVYGRGLYIIGGLHGSPTLPDGGLDDVLRAEIGADGTLGEWVTVSIMPVTLATHSAFVRGPYVYELGGVVNNVEITNTIRRAPFLADGTLGDWTEVLAPYPVTRAHVHQTPLYRDHVYAIGGTDARGQLIADVSIGWFR